MTDSQTRPNTTERRTDRSATDGPITGRTMGDVSHTHPYTARGAINRPFERGPVVAADGGERDAYDEDAEEDERTEESADAKNAEDESTTKMKMKDIDHTPPRDAEGANRVFERGGKEEPVESEE